MKHTLQTTNQLKTSKIVFLLPSKMTVHKDTANSSSDEFVGQSILSKKEFILMINELLNQKEESQGYAGYLNENDIQIIGIDISAKEVIEDTRGYVDWSYFNNSIKDFDERAIESQVVALTLSHFNLPENTNLYSYCRNINDYEAFRYKNDMYDELIMTAWIKYCSENEENFKILNNLFYIDGGENTPWELQEILRDLGFFHIHLG